MTVADLPAVNATLNALSAALLLAGLGAIKRRRIRVHKACMIAAFLVSMLFLASYLVYHAEVGSVRFRGIGPVRTAYLAILVTHTTLAVLVPPLAVVTLLLGLRERFARHVRVAKWTLPIWLYVSVTGVVVYAMLYHLVPSA
jgi:putative membrane protein